MDVFARVSETHTDLAVAAAPTIDARAAAEIIEEIAQLAYRFGFASDLRPAQWTALRFFDRSAKENCTVSAFAEHNRTSRSSASQTINGLVNRGLLVRVAVPEDRRTHRLHLTTRARALLGQDPLGKLEHALGEMAEDNRRQLTLHLQDLLGAMVRQIGHTRN